MTQGPIGEAHVLISPDLSRFTAELKAQLQAAIRAVKDPEIQVDPDLGGFSEKVKRETAKTERTTKAKVLVAPDLSRFAPEVRAFIARFDPKEQLKLAATLDRASFAKVAAEAKTLAAAAAPKIEVEVDVDRNRFQRLFAKAIVPSQESFEGFRAPLAKALSTPLGLAVAASLTQVLLISVPAAVSAGLGLGLVALGAFALRGSTILKTRFKAAGAAISESLRQAAQPLKGPFLQAIETLSGALLQLQPQLRGLFAGIAPSIKPLVDGLTGFLRNVLLGIQAAMPGINAAFAEFAARLPGLGQTLGGVFAAISENLPAIKRGIDLFFTFTEVILNVTGALLTFAQRVSSTFENIKAAVPPIVRHMLGWDDSQKAVAVSGADVANTQGKLALAAQESATKAGLLTEKLKGLKQGFREQVATVRESIESYKGLITQSGVTAGQVIRDLHNQVANFRTYSKDVKRLIREGVSPAAIQELSQKGPQYVHALATGSNRELERYKGYWRDRQREVRGSFAESMELQLGDLAKKIRAMQKEINRLKGKTVKVTAEASIGAPKGTLLLIEKGLAARGVKVPGRKAGGRITEGAGPTADDVLVRVSRGETVVPASASARPEFRSWAQTQRIPGFASGGQPAGDLDRFRAGMTRTDDSFHAVAVALGRGILAALKSGLSQALPAFTGAISHAAGSWKAATNFLTQAGIPFNIVSTFRPGAVTHASGRQSYHALNRAVDLTGPNMLAIWKALIATNPTELIYSRAPFYISRRGRRPIGQLDPITRADHFSHVHAAYDKGGLLMPGITVAHNRTGKPEMVTPSGRDAVGRVRVGGQGLHVENLIVQPISGRFRLADVATELALQGIR